MATFLNSTRGPLGHTWPYINLNFDLRSELPLIRIPRLVTGESISEQEARDIIAKIDSNDDDGVTKAELLAYGEVRETMAWPSASSCTLPCYTSVHLGRQIFNEHKQRLRQCVTPSPPHAPTHPSTNRRPKTGGATTIDFLEVIADAYDVIATQPDILETVIGELDAGSVRVLL